MLEKIEPIFHADIFNYVRDGLDVYIEVDTEEEAELIENCNRLYREFLTELYELAAYRW